MKNTNPTEAQIKEFWEWWGFSWWDTAEAWCFGQDEVSRELPPIDLNHLFKYAVPKLERNNLYDYIHFGYDNSLPDIITVQITLLDKLISTGEDKDPALALFWALDKVRQL